MNYQYNYNDWHLHLYTTTDCRIIMCLLRRNDNIYYKENNALETLQTYAITYYSIVENANCLCLH